MALEDIALGKRHHTPRSQNAPAQEEMVTELKTTGLPLGDRSRLRSICERGVGQSSITLGGVNLIKIYCISLVIIRAGYCFKFSIRDNSHLGIVFLQILFRSRFLAKFVIRGRRIFSDSF